MFEYILAAIACFVCFWFGTTIGSEDLGDAIKLDCLTNHEFVIKDNRFTCDFVLGVKNQ